MIAEDEIVLTGLSVTPRLHTNTANVSHHGVRHAVHAAVRPRPSQNGRGMRGRWVGRNTRTSLIARISPERAISAHC